MSAWTTNWIALTGDAAGRREFKEAVATAHEDFDFGMLVPMPQSLDIACGSSTDLGLACWSQEHFDTLSREQWFGKQYPDVHAPEQLRQVLSANEPEAVEVGKQALANLRCYGVPTWFEWCAREWGTKWNPSDVSCVDAQHSLMYEFNTAWDAPRGIVKPLLDLAHRLGLSVVWEARREGEEDIETIVCEDAEEVA